MIISRTLDIQPCRDGTIFASFSVIDDKGGTWRRSRSRFMNEAEAQTALDAYDWTPQIRDKQLQDAQEDVEAGKLSSLTTVKYKRRLVERLAEVQDRLQHYIVLQDRLKSALDRTNG